MRSYKYIKYIIAYDYNNKSLERSIAVLANLPIIVVVAVVVVVAVEGVSWMGAKRVKCVCG